MLSDNIRKLSTHKHTLNLSSRAEPRTKWKLKNEFFIKMLFLVQKEICTIFSFFHWMLAWEVKEAWGPYTIHRTHYGRSHSPASIRFSILRIPSFWIHWIAICVSFFFLSSSFHNTFSLLLARCSLLIHFEDFCIRHLICISKMMGQLRYG